MAALSRDAATGSLALAERLVITLHEVGVFARDGVAVNRGERVLGFAAAQFVGEAVADFEERFQNVLLHQVPLRRLGVALELGARGARAVAGLGDLVPQLRAVHHFLDVAQALGPAGVFVAGERAGFLAVHVPRTGGGAAAGPVEQVGEFVRALTALPRLATAIFLVRRRLALARLLRLGLLWIRRTARALTLTLAALRLLGLLLLLLL